MTAFQLGPTVYTPNAGVYGLGRIEGVPLNADVISRYGPRPLTPEMIAAGINSNIHEGEDYACYEGTALLAPASGVVHLANDLDDGRGFSLYVDSGNIRWRMGHLMEPARRYSDTRLLDLSSGDIVTRGEWVGKAGQTGRATGPHLHLDIMDLLTYTFINPASLYRSVIVAEPMAHPALSREQLLEPGLAARGTVMFTRAASQEIVGGEVYSLIVQRREDNGEVI